MAGISGKGLWFSGWRDLWPLLLVLLLLPGAPVLAAPACQAVGGAGDAASGPGFAGCTFDLGRYRLYRPARLALVDGKAPALIYFHGWRQQADQVVRSKALRAIADHYGLLLVVPEGLGGSWAFTGSPNHARDELAFAGQLLDDLRRNRHADPARIYAAGFSMGGSMVWELACHRPAGFAGFVAVSGAFWEPYPDHCATEPIRLLHFHGLSDPVVPVAGRPLGAAYAQGDVGHGLDIMAATHQCPADRISSLPPQPAGKLTLDCRVWQGCGDGSALEYCRHGGGHLRPVGWFDRAADWLGIPPLDSHSP